VRAVRLARHTPAVRGLTALPATGLPCHRFGRARSPLRAARLEPSKIRIEYKGLVFEEPLRCDVLMDDCLLLELKSVQEILPIHKA